MRTLGTVSALCAMLEPGKNKETVGNVAIGVQVWVEDAESRWVKGEVIEINNNKVKVGTNNGSEVTSNLSNVLPTEPNVEPGGVDDMTKLTYFHESAVLYILAKRYELGKFYTKSGNILISVNPFVNLPHLYNNHTMEQYRGVSSGELSPHVFSVADASYRALVTEERSQSILVSGESGAGKSETTRLLLQYLVYMGDREDSGGRNLEHKVVESISLLEAFGNAKIKDNDNSSRFCKYVKIQYDRNGRISGAAVCTYLLERSRVVRIADSERNFHCFYQLCASLEEREKYKLGNARSFHCLNQSECYELDGVNDYQKYIQTRRSMDVLGVNPDEQEAVFRILASVLHLGNIEFDAEPDTDSLKFKDGKSRYHFEVAADLLRCESKGLLDLLVTQKQDDNITLNLNVEQATLSRDTLVKTIYSRLFGWLVEKVNRCIAQDQDSSFFVGVLDSPGFESFNYNSFEQFCMNWAEEKLQQQFNQNIFKEYIRDASKPSPIEFVDNQDVLDLIEKPTGIVAHLDEACMSFKATNETLTTNLFRQYIKHKQFSKPELASTNFTIKHSFGDVTYETERILIDNRSNLIEHLSLLRSSTCSFVSSFLPRSSDEGFRSSCVISSISTEIKQQLQSLMDSMNGTEFHYIRCVKPNILKKPGCFENQAVRRQLRRGGLLDAIKCGQLTELDNKTLEISSDAATKDGNQDLIGMEMDVIKIQKYWRGTLARQQYLKLQTDHMQNQLRKQTKAATIIQARWRGYKSRSQYNKVRKGAITFQCAWRGRVARRELRKFKSVSPGALKLILEYCRFHRVPGRSDKERKVFDERFVRLDTRRLCELTSAADSLDMKPLGDLTSRALARMIEGKTPEQIREIFHLPDDLTEEEKLEPVKMSTDDPRIRLLNRLYARKRKELQEKKLLKNNTTDSTIEKQVKDERSVEELVSFIDGESKNNKVGKPKKKKNRRKKGQSDESAAVTSRPQTEVANEDDEKLENEKLVRETSNPRVRGTSSTILEHYNRLLRDQDKVFEEENFEDDGIDPALKEIVDREVEDFARRLNSDWLKRPLEVLSLASPSHEGAKVLNSDFGDKSLNSIHLGNRSNGNFICDYPEDNRILQQQAKRD